VRNETIEQHYRHHYKILVKRAAWRVPNKSVALAEEVVQEAYSRAIKYWKTFDPNKNKFGAWFNRIYNGCVADCMRAENGGLPSLNNDDEWLEPFILNDSDWVPKEMAIRIQEGIKAQRDEASEILNLFFNLGLTTPEIHEITGVNHNTIRQTIRRFRIKWEDENIF
jgi:RNA polymerase sigma factor (sigma-70 family)